MSASVAPVAGAVSGATATPRAPENASPLRVLHVAAEGLPFSKTGGLADVIGALPPALARLGVEVGVVLPAHVIAARFLREQ